MFENSVYPRTEYDQKTGKISFLPCVYEQRYTTIHELLLSISSTIPLKKIIDFGCAELGFFTLLKTVPNLEQLIHIDIDEELLNNNVHKVKPLLCDYLRPKSQPFRVQIIQGNIAETDPIIVNADVIICIELIEHLYPPVLEKIPEVILSASEPLMAIFTTPNFEYNVLFPEPERFRHYDHKFEWTREQFGDWAHNLCLRYPNYMVTFKGIGPPPAGYEHIGCATQMAIFTKQFSKRQDSSKKKQFDQKYKLLYDIEYPKGTDELTINEKILYDSQHRIAKLSDPNCERYEEFSFDNNNHLLIPIKEISKCLVKYSISEETLLDILQSGGLTINNKNEIVVISGSDTTSSEEEKFEESSIKKQVFIKNIEEEPEIWD